MQNNHLKPLLLAASLTLVLSACGSKGALYQTPKSKGALYQTPKSIVEKPIVEQSSDNNVAETQPTDKNREKSQQEQQ